MILAQELAKRINAVRYEDLPPEARHWAKIGILDLVGVTLAGAREDTTRIGEGTLALGAGGGTSLVFGSGKRVSALDGDFHPLKLIRGFEHMSALVQSQLKSVLDAYAAQDLPAAMTVWKGDEEVDSICTSLFRELLTYMMEDPRNIYRAVRAQSIAKYLERIGDHATNVAEMVIFMVMGKDVRHLGSMVSSDHRMPRVVPAHVRSDGAPIAAAIVEGRRVIDGRRVIMSVELIE